MSRFRKSVLMQLAAMLAMVVQLCVVSFHHHTTLGGHGFAHGHEVHAALAENVQTGDVHDVQHGHDDFDDSDHGPDRGTHHDCETCVLKSAVSGQLMPEGHLALMAPVRTGKRQLTATSETRKPNNRHRYHARAPPSQAALS